MPEIHLKQRGFTYSAWGQFTNNKEKKKNLMKQEKKNVFIEIN